MSNRFSEMYSWQAKGGGEGGEDGGGGVGSGKNLTIFLVEATTVMGEIREGDPDGYNALQVSVLSTPIMFTFVCAEVFELYP